MIIQFPSGPMANLQYLILNQASKDAIAIDPAWHATRPIELATQYGCHITQIWVTHGHFDHVNALDELQAATQARVHIHTTSLLSPLPPHTPIQDGDILNAGDWTFKVLHTPGHSRDSVCFLSQNTPALVEQQGDIIHITRTDATPAPYSGVLISGDTLFIGSCGRVDLPTSSPLHMMQSLQQLSQLPLDTLVCPGHDYGEQKVGTISAERQYNAAMQQAMSR